MNGKAGGPVVNYNDILDVPTLQELNQILDLELSIWMWCAALSSDDIVKVFLVLLQRPHNGPGINVEACCEENQLEITFQLR